MVFARVGEGAPSHFRLVGETRTCCIRKAMNVRTEADGSVSVFTFREGALAAVGHDLCIRCDAFRIEWSDADKTRVAGFFDLRSLRVLHSVGKDGQAEKISDGDRRTIESHLHSDVLRTQLYPTASFASDVVGEAEVRGRLTICNVTRPIVVTFERTDGFYIARSTIAQTMFGITPFRAMLGALRVRDDVQIRLRVPA